MSIRIEGKTAHVETVAEAMRAASLPGVEDVVIEDNTERIRMQRFIKAMRQIR